MDEDILKSIITQRLDLGWLRESEVARFFKPYIHGIEVTQAIQHYRSREHLTDRNDHGRDNGIHLIAGKPAWVRVYVRSGRPDDVPGVTGTLEVLRKSSDFVYEPVTSLSPNAPGSVVARRNPAYETERLNTRNTLNFIIPDGQLHLGAGWQEIMCGELRLRVTIEAPGGYTDTMEVDVRATLQQTLRVRMIPITYNGPASSAMNAPTINLAAASMADLRRTSALALTMFPVQSQGTYSRAAAFNQTQHLQDTVAPGGGCSPNWNALLTALQQARTDDGNRSDWLYYGLLPTGTPVGATQGTNSGCGTDGIAASAVGDGMTMAHELAHACGVRHAPCGSVGTGAQQVEVNYPAYEPYDPAGTPQASIGEFGLDISTGRVFSPQTTRDFMSYCGPSWISLYTYTLLQNNDRLAPSAACHPATNFDWDLYDPFWWLPGKRPGDPIMRERLISIIGLAHGPDRIEVTSVMRVEAERSLRDATVTPLRAELVGANGQTIAQAPLYRLNAFGGGCCCDERSESSQYPYAFQSFVTDMEPGAALLIHREDTELWSRRAPESAPQVGGPSASVGEEGLMLYWEAYAATETPPEVWAQWSSDEGQTWHGLAVGLTENRALIPTVGLPAGTLYVRLLVGDGFQTTVSESVPVEIPLAAPEVSILAPRDRQTLPAGGPIRLWGVAHSNSGEEIRPESAQWFLDDSEAGLGFDVFTGGLEPGEHRAILRVGDRSGESEAVVYFMVADTPREG